MPYMHDLPDELLNRISAEQDRYIRLLPEPAPKKQPSQLWSLLIVGVVTVALTMFLLALYAARTKGHS